MTSEAFLLKWNDFEQNITDSFRKLRQNGDFSDVTLVCEDNMQFEAHRIILSSFSPFFSNIIQRNNHPHPIIFIRGMSSRDLTTVLDFIYHGETSVDQKYLEDFFTLAGELQIKGIGEHRREQNMKKNLTENVHIKNEKTLKEPPVSHTNKENKVAVVQTVNTSLSDSTDETLKDAEDLENYFVETDENIESKIADSVKMQGMQKNITIDQETITEENKAKYQLNCGDCGKKYGTKASLRAHRSTKHPKKDQGSNVTDQTTVKNENNEIDTKKGLEGNTMGEKNVGKTTEIENTSKDISFPCNWCGVKNTTEKELMEHIKDIHKYSF